MGGLFPESTPRWRPAPGLLRFRAVSVMSNLLVNLGELGPGCQWPDSICCCVHGCAATLGDGVRAVVLLPALSPLVPARFPRGRCRVPGCTQNSAAVRTRRLHWVQQLSQFLPCAFWIFSLHNFYYSFSCCSNLSVCVLQVFQILLLFF